MPSFLDQCATVRALDRESFQATILGGQVEGGVMKAMVASIFGALLLAASAPSAAAPVTSPPADQPAKLAEANAIIEIMFPPAERERTFDKLAADLAGQFRAGMPASASTDPGFKAIVDQYLDRALQLQKPLLRKHLPAMFEAMALAYTREFSITELRNIHAFAETPAGRHYLSRSTAILSDPAVAKVNSEMIADAQKLSMALITEMKDELLAYLKAHPEVAERMAAESKAQ